MGAALILILRGDDKAVARNARYIALWTSLIVFAIFTVVSLVFLIPAGGKTHMLRAYLLGFMICSWFDSPATQRVRARHTGDDSGKVHRTATYHRGFVRASHSKSSPEQDPISGIADSFLKGATR